MSRPWIVSAGLCALVAAFVAPAAAQDIMPTPTPRPSPAPVRPAGITASAHESLHDAAQAADENRDTHWSADGDGAWLELDLGRTVQLARIHAAFPDAARYVYDLQLSIDRESWVTVFQLLPGGTMGALDFPDRDARYVRYVGHGRIGADGTRGTMNALSELTIFANQTPSIAAPASLRALAIHDGGAVTLEWGSGAVPSYRVYRSVSSQGPYVAVGASPFETTFTDAGLSHGTRYCYVVTAGHDVARQSFYSPEACAVVSTASPAPAAPAAPAGLCAQGGFVDCDGVTAPLLLTWTAGARASLYEVWRATLTRGPYTKVANAAATRFGVGDGRDGFYVVRSVNTGGVSGHSNEVPGRFTRAHCPGRWAAVRPEAVTASGHDGNVPANTVDRSLETRWSALGDGAWLQLDLGARYTVTHVQLAVYRGHERRNAFQLFVSADLATWTPLFQGRTSGATADLETFDVPDLTGTRYVRYVGHGNDRNAWNSLTGVRIFTR